MSPFGGEGSGVQIISRLLGKKGLGKATGKNGNYFKIEG
jgi:hypothetical protein